MKIRNGFVSNSSSSSFVVIKDGLNNYQIDMILRYQYYIEEILKNDEIDDIRYKFEYYDSDPWQIIEYEDFIFGETSMDNFDISNYLDYIKVDSSMICWDEGCVDKPWIEQINFVNNMKQKIRKI